MCADCHVPLVTEAPLLPEPCAKPDDPGLELVQILSTYHAADIAIIRSYFDAANIRYFVEGETFNMLRPLVQPMRIAVVRDDVRASREILEGLHLHYYAVNLTRKDNEAEDGE